MIAKMMMGAALLSGQPAQAPPAPRPCVTHQQLADMTVIAAPYLIEGIGRRCQQHLEPGSFIRAEGPALVQRFRTEAPQRMPSAMTGFSRFGGMDLPPEVTPEVMTALIRAGVEQQLLANVTSQTCRNANELVRALAPLPPENVGRMISSLLALVRPRSGDNGPNVCPA